jgi:cytoskeletal protein CcmA (bactofilin family)
MPSATFPPTSNEPIPLPTRFRDRPAPAQADDIVRVEHRAEDNAHRLIVGRGIALSGEISNCEHLVVEGWARATVADCRMLDVAVGGALEGKARVDDACIAGEFDGDLTVTGRLTIRETGKVSGSIRYGELTVEAGGRTFGAIEPVGPESGALCQVIPHPAAEQPKDPMPE